MLITFEVQVLNLFLNVLFPASDIHILHMYLKGRIILETFGKLFWRVAQMKYTVDFQAIHEMHHQPPTCFWVKLLFLFRLSHLSCLPPLCTSVCSPKAADFPQFDLAEVIPKYSKALFSDWGYSHPCPPLGEYFVDISLLRIVWRTGFAGAKQITF